jgi:hypothetical protein
MFSTLFSVFKGARWEDNVSSNPQMRLVVGDTEYRIGWEKKLCEDNKDEEKKQIFNDLLGDVLKYCLKHAARSFPLANPNFRDIDNNTIYIKSITSHKITPLFAVSTVATGVKTTIGYSTRAVQHLLFIESLEKVVCKLIDLEAKPVKCQEIKLTTQEVRDSISNLKDVLVSSDKPKSFVSQQAIPTNLHDKKKNKVSFQEVTECFNSAAKAQQAIRRLAVRTRSGVRYHGIHGKAPRRQDYFRRCRQGCHKPLQ